MSITEEQIERLKADHPTVELHLLDSPENDVQVVVRCPPEAEWRRFRALQTDDEQRANALRVLLTNSLIYPKGAEFAAILAAKPGLAETFGAKLVKIAGVDGTATSRKL